MKVIQNNKKTRKIIEITLIIGFSILFLCASTHIFIKNTIKSQNVSQIKITPLKVSQDYDHSLSIPQNFSLIEKAEDIDSQKNASSIYINLGTSRWNLSNLSFNISNMYFKNETKVIEDNPISTRLLYKQLKAFAVQIDVPTDTKVYGVKIYGKRIQAGAAQIKLQINGCNKLNNKPNNTVYGSVSLNMSTDVKWYNHQFSVPASLTEGSYYLILNGTLMGPSDSGRYNWYYNEQNPKYPQLYIWEHTGGIWDNGVIGSPFLYMLDQKITKNFYPEEINMTTKINGIDRYFKNGNKLGSGNLSLSFNNYFPNASNLNIPVKNNVSEALIFNVSYYVKLNNSLVSSGSIEIKDGLDNKWTIEPNLERFGWNYSISYNYPKPWKTMEVYRNSLKLFENTDYINSSNTLYVLNKTVPDTLMSWEIVFNTTNTPINLNVPKPEWTVGQILEFSLAVPIKSGNYTFILCDPNEFVKNNKLYLNPDSGTIFNYTIPSTAVNGNWKAYIYWNNITDAGATTQIFQISGGSSPLIPPIDGGVSNNDSTSTTTIEGITPTVFIAVIISIIVGFSGIVSTYVGLKEVRRRRELQKENVYNEFMDIYNLSYIMISHRKSGLNVFEKSFAGANLNPTLISGYLNALNMFGIEITGSLEQSQSIKLEYQNLIILMNDFKNLRMIVILKENPSKSLLKAMSRLSYEINDVYGDKLEKFDGVRLQFDKIGALIEKNLKTSLISPLQVKKIDLTLLNQTETDIIQKAKHIVKRNNFPYIFASYLIPGQQYNYDYAKAIIDLIDKGILIALKSENIK